MGLFSSNKKTCPICGGATPKLFATKIGGLPICKECAGKVFLPDGMLNTMNIDSFMQYMNYYEQNQPLREWQSPQDFCQTSDNYVFHKAVLSSVQFPQHCWNIHCVHDLWTGSSTK